MKRLVCEDGSATGIVANFLLKWDPNGRNSVLEWNHRDRNS